MHRILLPLVLLLSLAAQAFDLDSLSARLQALHNVQGQFSQERYLKDLPQALHSSGSFVLISGQGLLWEMQQPFPLRLRLDSRGIAQQDGQGRWQPAPQSGQQRQIELFMALLGGDTARLGEHFSLSLSGTAEDWQLLLTPKTALLQQIFDSIRLQGDAFIRSVEIRETQGERSLIRFEQLRGDAPLPPSAAQALAE